MMNKAGLLLAFLAMTFFLRATTTTFGQESHGAISGTVVDPAGAAVPGAVVTATETRTGVRTPTKTNAIGAYSFPFLAAGEYQIEVESAGFRTFRQTNVQPLQSSRVRFAECNSE